MTDYSSHNLSKCIDGHKGADYEYSHAKVDVDDLVKANYEYLIEPDPTTYPTFDKACAQSPLRSACVVLANGDLIAAKLGGWFVHFQGGRLVGMARAADYVNAESWHPLIQFRVVKEQVEEVA